ncbi:MAG: hypothetical protein JNM51_10350 [Bacteroidia bacterium]|nr:hypothetical protein [Bacteroidia bacterium]
MKFKSLLLILISVPTIFFGQQLSRKILDYEKLKIVEVYCDSSTIIDLERAMVAIDGYQSERGVEISKSIFDKNQSCPQIFEVYAYSLFRNGKWFEGIDILEKGIELFGAVPELIKKRSEMSIEMAQMGVGEKVVDGNSIYVSGKNALAYDEKQFKEENYKSALLDLIYLKDNYGRPNETYLIGMVNQILGNYEKSSEAFETLLADKEYMTISAYNIADNYMSLKQFDKAEKEFTNLSMLYPHEPEIYNKLAELYGFKKDSVKIKDFRNKSNYFSNIPSFTELEYNNENFELLKFFSDESVIYKNKSEKLKDIYKTKSQSYTIDVCLMILKLHANHGNGLEDDASKLLAKIGLPSIEKTHKLFRSNISTCTITYLADIMAQIKDSTSWNLLVDFLPSIANMPMTLIPPSVPEKLILFNEQKGLIEILKVVKPLLSESQDNSSNPMAQLGSFNQFVYYYPLQKLKQKEVLLAAKKLNYTDSELEKLKRKIKK